MYRLINLIVSLTCIFAGVGVRMTQRQNDTVRHFGIEGHFGTARQNDMVCHLGTVPHFGTEGHFRTVTK